MPIKIIASRFPHKGLMESEHTYLIIIYVYYYNCFFYTTKLSYEQYYETIYWYGLRNQIVCIILNESKIQLMVFIVEELRKSTRNESLV